MLNVQRNEKLLVYSSRDRIRTVVNVMGDSVGAGVVMHLCKDDLVKLDENAVAIDEKFQNTHC